MSINDNINEFETKKTRKRKAPRDGRSVTYGINEVPTKALVAMGFSEEAAKLILATRRVLPVVEDQLLPQIDARKLWERIGKPHGEFRYWADHYIKPRLPSAEISPLETQGKRGGSPRKDYLLSRPMAASLAMQANTDEGEQIRRYFYLMEQVVLRLTERNFLRGERIIGIDKAIYHQSIKRISEEQGLRGYALNSTAKEEEIRVKSRVTLILTGFKPGYWSDIFGTGIRDVLNNKDATKYEDAYRMALTLLNADKGSNEELKAILEPTYKGKIDMRPYLEARGLDPALADVKKRLEKQRLLKAA